MKKILALICCLACVFCLSSCTYTKRGLENFSPWESEYRLTSQVPESLINAKQYISGEYLFQYRSILSYFEKFILWLEYDEALYDKAKEASFYVNDIYADSDTPEITINSYEFYLSPYENSFEKLYPDQTIYLYVVVNDSEGIVCFLGLISSYSENKKQSERIDTLYETEGLKGIIDEYFIEWYDFYETN